IRSATILPLRFRIFGDFQLCLALIISVGVAYAAPEYSHSSLWHEICLALSLGYAATRHQAIEVGMVNYLWPSLTILFAILFNGQ
ncbi:hypothetical protein MJN47_30105, partial [Salmonella enterica subsp. enterica serovar Lubbock]|nr:hypothetical protein [Salmonella enterica subsp. enterica serovar Lubbock]